MVPWILTAICSLSSSSFACCKMGDEQAMDLWCAAFPSAQHTMRLWCCQMLIGY